MKKFICLNHGECEWADEKPPKEFTISVDEENICPNCESTNIREIQPPISKRKKIIPIVLGVFVSIGLLFYLFSKGKPPVSDSPTAPTQPVDTLDQGKSGPTVVPVDNPKINSKKPLKLTYKKIEGSEFCVGECTLSYSEIDNLGRIRDRRIENYAKCCSVNK